MKWNMDCHDFHPTDELMMFMRKSLSEIQHMSPYESYVDASVEKKIQ